MVEIASLALETFPMLMPLRSFEVTAVEVTAVVKPMSIPSPEDVTERLRLRSTLSVKPALNVRAAVLPTISPTPTLAVVSEMAIEPPLERVKRDSHRVGRRDDTGLVAETIDRRDESRSAVGVGRA